MGGSGVDTHEYAECSNKVRLLEANESHLIAMRLADAYAVQCNLIASSSQGYCDHATGECQCFSGFEGYACDRSSCPNQCSGHGVCRFIEELGTYDSRNWDAGKIQGCSCDGGWTGDDCSKRICPVGDDPLTVPTSSTGATYRVDVNQDASLTLTAADVHLVVTDLAGIEHTSRPLPLEALTADTVESALLDIPAIKSLDGAVTIHDADSFSFTLESPLRLASVTAVPGTCTDAGCQPKHRAQNPADIILSATVTPTMPDALAESAECANRGVCDSSTGLCSCFSGYTGLACQMQTVLV